VSSFDVSLEKQEVLVKSELGYDTILEKLKKTGKEVSCALSGITAMASKRYPLTGPFW
jgi:hypothetical protein